MTSPAPDPAAHAFLTALIATPPSNLTGIDRASPPRRALHVALTLTGDATGGDRYARDVLIRVRAAGVPHTPHGTFMDALAAATQRGVLTDATVTALIAATRHHLPSHILRCAQQLARADPPAELPYSALYTDLRYFTPRTQTRWQTTLHHAHRSTP